MADRIGQLAATKFYSAGVSNAQQYLAGVEAAMAVANSRLAGKGLKLADVKGISAGFDNGNTARSTAVGRPGASYGDPGAGVTNYVINVNGVMSNAQTGEEIINHVRAFNRAAGPANIQVA